MIGEKETNSQPLVFANVCSMPYLPQAMALYRSLRGLYSEIDFYILVSDLGETIILPEEDTPFLHILTLNDLPDCSEIVQLRSYYNDIEYHSALKFFMVRYCLGVIGGRGCHYVDSDLFFYSKIPDEWRADGVVSVTPHVTSFEGFDGFESQSVTSELLLSGMINGGFFYFDGGDESTRILEWVLNRARTNFFIAPGFGFYADQPWLSMLPFLSDRIQIIKDARANVAYWNLASRRLKLDKGKPILVDHDQCVVFFHYSGFSMNSKERLTRHLNTVFDTGTERVLAALLEDYVEAIEEARQILTGAVVVPVQYANDPVEERIQRVERQLGKAMAFPALNSKIGLMTRLRRFFKLEIGQH